MDERFLFALQSAQFSPTVAKPIARPASCSFVPASRGLREPWEFCCETVYAVQPFESGLGNGRFTIARIVNSDAKRGDAALIWRGALKQISWNYGWNSSNNSRISLRRDSRAYGRSVFVLLHVILTGLFILSPAGCGGSFVNLATPEGAIVGRGQEPGRRRVSVAARSTPLTL